MALSVFHFNNTDAHTAPFSIKFADKCTQPNMPLYSFNNADKRIQMQTEMEV